MSKNKTIIGLTGGIASGKTEVSKYLQRRGMAVLCADQVAHDVMKPDRLAYKKILRHFGQDVLVPGGQIDRVKLSKIVFKSVAARRHLEEIIHPEVIREIKLRIKMTPQRFVVLDVPLLFESGMEKFCDFTVCVATWQKLQISRLSKRNHLSREAALARIRAHWKQARKIKAADFVIWNIGSKQQLQAAVKRLLTHLNGLF